MELTQVLVTNGIVVGAVITDKGKEKRARLSDVRKFVETGRITTGARIINDRLYIEPSILQCSANQQHFKIDKLEYNEDNLIISATFDDGRQCELSTLWSLAADGRVEGITSAYLKETDSKILITA